MGTASCACLASPRARSSSLSKLPTSQRTSSLLLTQRLPRQLHRLRRLSSPLCIRSDNIGTSSLLRTRRLPRKLHRLRRLSSPLCIRSDSSGKADEKTPFGYTRKDVLLIGLGLTVVGVGLKYGLEFLGVDSTKAGNVVQLVMVLGLTVGWISTYVFRVSTKEMTYAKQLEDYENKVIQKRLEELPEAELETLLAQVEEEKQRIKQRREKMSSP